MEVANSALPVSQGLSPQDCVEVYHLHCHFDARSEPVALLFLEETKRCIERDGGTVLHSHSWHEKNGPHIGWSWELWVDKTQALGAAVHHFMRSRPEPLRLCLHADTDQEYTDHGARLGFVGPTDALDLLFFQPPDAALYNGPISALKSTEKCIYSMGEFWDKKRLREGYGALDRKPQEGTTMPSLFLPHGSPPVPIERCSSEKWLASAASTLPSKPRGGPPFNAN